MKKSVIIVMIAMLGMATFSSCKKYLDVNTDPDTPQFPDVASVFPTQLAGIPRGLQFDGRYAGRYVQNWLSSRTNNAAITFDNMGYTGASDNNGDIWRQTYYGLGKNLNYIIDEGIKKEQWDYVGAAYALKAMMFQYATDYHGEIIFSEAFVENKATFKFDSQETVYKGVDSLCRLALSYLNNTKYNPSSIRLQKADYIYNGNTAKWIKFTNGLLARNFHRLTNKSIYNADSVIHYANLSLAVVEDDFVIPFDATKNDDTNFWGTYRDNLSLIRQSNFIVKLLDGTTLSGTAASAATASNRDPRLKHMLTTSQDTTNGNGGYRGIDPGVEDPFAVLTAVYAVGSTNWVNARKRVSTPWADSSYANPSAAVFSSQYRRYLFADKVVFPVMTASEIQFMKAEAAFRKGEKEAAIIAYTKGINLHFDFINRGSWQRGNGVLYNTSPISAAERAAYLNGNNVERIAGNLKLSDIMLQKYIALWGWGFFETFVDLRRYHYLDTEIDPVTLAPTQVYLNFALPLPTTLAAENLGKPVYRVRPRYNSEYVWNRPELLKIGALNGDYHTYEPWFSQP